MRKRCHFETKNLVNFWYKAHEPFSLTDIRAISINLNLLLAVKMYLKVLNKIHFKCLAVAVAAASSSKRSPCPFCACHMLSWGCVLPQVLLGPRSHSCAGASWPFMNELQAVYTHGCCGKVLFFRYSPCFISYCYYYSFLAFFFFQCRMDQKKWWAELCCLPSLRVGGWCVLRPSSLPRRCCDYWCTAHRLHAARSPSACLWGALLGQKGLGSTVVAEGKQLGACGVGCWWSHPCQQPLCFSNGC